MWGFGPCPWLASECGPVPLSCWLSAVLPLWHQMIPPYTESPLCPDPPSFRCPQRSNCPPTMSHFCPNRLVNGISWPHGPFKSVCYLYPSLYPESPQSNTDKKYFSTAPPLGSQSPPGQRPCGQYSQTMGLHLHSPVCVHTCVGIQPVLTHNIIHMYLCVP